MFLVGNLKFQVIIRISLYNALIDYYSLYVYCDLSLKVYTLYLTFYTVNNSKIYD